MTSRRMYRHLVRRKDALSEDDLTRGDAHAELWGVVLESSAAGRRLARELEAHPERLDLSVAEFAKWATTVHGVSEGRAGRVVAVLALAHHVARLGVGS